MLKIKCLLRMTMLLSLVCMMLASCDREPCYKNDGKQVTWNTWDVWAGHHSIVVDADPSTFEDLGDGYARDGQQAFLEGNIIKGADGKTFKCLEKPYAVDSYHVFHCDTMMTSADPKSFKVHGQYLTEDKKDYYWCGKPIHVVDKKTFVIIGDKDDEKTQWAKDKLNAYYMGKQPVSLADYNSFHQIGDINDLHCSGCYAADKYRVYFEDHVVEGADPETFTEVIWYVGQDKHRVYDKWKATDIKDYKQLSQIGGFYSDGLHIYTKDFEVFEDADPLSFRQLEGSTWYVDKDHVWWLEKQVKEADAATIQLVHMYKYFNGSTLPSPERYAKDKSHVFFDDSIIPGADPESFEVIQFVEGGPSAAFDKNRIYSGENSNDLKKYLKDKYSRKR